MDVTGATTAEPDTAIKTRTLQTTETLKIALAQTISIPLSGRMLPPECFDFVSPSLLKHKNLSYEKFATSSDNGPVGGGFGPEKPLPILKPGRTPNSTKTLSMLEAMFVALQAPNELRAVQLHIYEDDAVTKELVEIHRVQLESNKTKHVYDEQVALHNLLYLPSVTIATRNGFNVHVEEFPSLELRMRRMKVQVEHLQLIRNTQETTQGSLRDPRTEKFLKAVSQDMNTPEGGDPTQQRPSQEWYDEGHVEKLVKPPINCPCGSSTEEPGMMQCTTCTTRQHAGCYGRLHFNSQGVVMKHICWFCLFSETLRDGEKRRELCDMARLRRAVTVIWMHGFVNMKTLAAQLGCSQTNARRILDCLTAWQFLQKPSSTNAGEEAYSVTKEGQKQDALMKWFVGGHRDYRV
ncbi:MAG: DNA binding protein [Bathelium mastoideum]|nr:MAG: DNA binding protein [Bathelium mastoideum]